jgi:hypothetical protein
VANFAAYIEQRTDSDVDGVIDEAGNVWCEISEGATQSTDAATVL